MSLSSSEKITLRRVGDGVASDSLRPDHIDRFVRLGLVTCAEGDLVLTKLGRVRLATIARLTHDARLADWTVSSR
jgi:hypothetical protein